MSKSGWSSSASTSRYIKTHCKTYVVRCNVEYDADIIALLDEQPNKAGYVKEILRRIAAKKGFGHLRRENEKAKINPAAGEIDESYIPDGL